MPARCAARGTTPATSWGSSRRPCTSPCAVPTWPSRSSSTSAGCSTRADARRAPPPLRRGLAARWCRGRRGARVSRALVGRVLLVSAALTRAGAAGAVRRRRTAACARLLGVVGDVPARALELDGGRGQQLAYLAATGRTCLHRRVRELLDHLETVSTGVALVLVQRHGRRSLQPSTIAGGAGERPQASRGPSSPSPSIRWRSTRNGRSPRPR